LNDQSNAAYWNFADYVHASRKRFGGPPEKRQLADQTAALDNAARDQGKKLA